MAQLAKVKRLAFDAGWMRAGWPERVGGTGGSTLTRAYLGEALTARDLVEPGLYSMTEVLAPTMIDYAAPDLAAAMVPALLRGDETWCQGFSEPDTGSNLAALACRAERTDQGWRVQRTEGLDEPGPVRRPLRPADPDGLRRVGPPGDHRPLRGHGLPRDHGPAHRHHARQRRILRAVPRRRPRPLLPHPRRGGGRLGGGHGPPPLSSGARRCGTAPPSCTGDSRNCSRSPRPVRSTRPGSARSPSCSTPSGPARGPRSTAWPTATALGPETSIDKVLLATAEQAVFDLVADVLAPEVTTGDDPVSARWRSEYLYSRAASIYGGSAEIQRNIIARRLLDLGNDR